MSRREVVLWATVVALPLLSLALWPPISSTPATTTTTTTTLAPARAPAPTPEPIMCGTAVRRMMGDRMQRWAAAVESVTWDRTQGAKLRPLQTEITALSWPACSGDLRTKSYVYLDSTIKAIQFGSGMYADVSKAASDDYALALARLDSVPAQ